MPQKINLNVNPYNDDFDSSKGFYRVLFRPGYSVQTRELTTLQSILQNQIENIGRSQFKQGQQVVPGEVSLNTNLNYVKLSSVSDEAVNVNGNIIFQKYDISKLTGYTLQGLSSGVTASVISYEYATETESDVLYVKYTNSGNSGEEFTFRQGETLEVVDIENTPLLIVGTDGSVLPSSIDVIDYVTGNITNIDSPALGFASAIKVNPGVYFINGHFVNNQEQILVVDKYYNKPSAKVGFTIVEDVITPETDSSLYDNAKGFSNFSAPGAHRLKIDLLLTVYPYDSIIPDDFVQLLSVRNGDIEKLIKQEEVNTVENIVARRTYDESGNYVVDNFSIDLREFYLKNNNQGVYPLDSTTNLVNGLKPFEAEQKMIASLGTGKAYVKGFEILNSETKYITLDKSRDTLKKTGNRIKISPLSSFNISNVYNSVPLNAEGEDLVAYPDLYFNSTFNDGCTGFNNIPDEFNRRGLKFTLDDGIVTVYVQLSGENPIFPVKNDIGKKVWFVTSRGTTVNNVIVKSAIILNYSIVTRPELNTGGFQYVEYTLYGKKDDLLTLKDYDEENDIKNRYLFKSNSVNPEEDNGQNLATGYYYTPQDDEPYAKIVDYNEIFTPIIGVAKPKNFFLQKKGLGFNKDTDIVLSKGRSSINNESAYNSIFNVSYFNPVFFTKITVDSLLDDLSFKIGKYIYGLKSGAYGVIEGLDGGVYSTSNILFVRTIFGEFVSGETIVDEDGNSKRIARDNTISHFITLKRGSNYISTAVLDNEVSKIIINNVTYETNAIQISTFGSGVYKVDIINRDLVSEVYNSVPSVSATIGSGAVIFPVLYKNSVVTYTPQNVKSLFAEFGSAQNKYVFTADVESFDPEYTESKSLTDFTFSGAAGFKYIECNGFSGDPSVDLIQGDVVQFSYVNGTVERCVVQYVTKPYGLLKSRIYLNIALKNTVDNVSAVRLRPIVSNSTSSSLIVPTGSKYIKTVVNSVADSGINYFIRRDFVTKLGSNGNNITFAAQLQYGTQRFASFTENNFLITIIDPDLENNPQVDVSVGDIIYLSADQVRITNSTETSTGLTAGSVSITLPLNFFGTINSFDNFKIKLTATIEVSKAKPKLKSLIQNKRIIITSPGDRVIPLRGKDYDQNSTDILSYSDVKTLKFIYEGSPSVPPVVDSNGNLISGVDVTNKFTFDDGQRDTFYDVSRIILKPGVEPITGQLVVGFDYFEHSQGDFCTVDSYVHEAGVVLSEIPTFDSSVYGKISLRDVFDFRPKVDYTTIVSGFQDTSILNNPISFTKSGGSISNTIASDLNIEYNLLFDLDQYLDRIDGVFLNKSGDFVIERGTASLNPSQPLASEDVIPLYYLYIPAYTTSVNDVNITSVENKRYTMKDIGKIEKRLERLEQYTTLSILEQQALNMQIKDEIGIERFKTGFIVDNFESHKVGNLSSLDYKCAIDTQQSVLRPRSYETSLPLIELNNIDVDRAANHYVRKNDVVTLPYDNVVFIRNSFATKKININQFSVSQYVGDAKLGVSVSRNYSKEVFPTILNNDSNLFSVFYAKNSCEDGISSIYNNYIVNWIGSDRVFFNSNPLDQSLLNSFSTSLAASVSSSSNISPQNTELAKGVFINKNGSNNVVSSIKYFCKSEPVKFNLTRLKPKTKFYVFIDGKNVDRWVVSDSYYTGIAGSSLSTFNSGITTDENGNASGVILIPSGYAPVSGSAYTKNPDDILYDNDSIPLYFITGTKDIRFTTSDVGQITTDVESFAQTYYYATGSSIQNPANIVSTSPSNFKSEEGIQLFNGSKVKPNPIIQTFKVENYPGGVFLTGLELFFSKKENTSNTNKQNLPVRVYLTNIENGKPGKYIIPGTEITKVSDTYLRVYVNGTLKITQGERLTGASSGCFGPIKSVLDKNNLPLIASTSNEYTLSENQIYTIVLSNHNGKVFKQNEEVRTDSLNLLNATQSSRLRITIAKDSGKLSKLELQQIGSGYESASVTIESPQLVGGINATGNVYVSDGCIFDVSVSVPGSGYTAPPAVIIKGTGSAPAGAVITSQIEIDTPAVRMGVACDYDNNVSNVPTLFEFDYPIYLQNDVEYAFAIESDSSDYEVWVSKLGENEILTNSLISAQPLLGSLFKSQNSENWTEDIFEDVKFTLHRAEFDISITGNLDLINTSLGYEKIETNPFESYSLSDSSSTSNLFKNNNTIVKVSHKNHGFEDSGLSFTAFKKVSNLNGISAEEINFNLFKIVDAGTEYYTIQLPSESSSTGFSGGSNVFALNNKKYEKLFCQVDYITAPNTTIDSSVMTTNIAAIDDDNPIFSSYSQPSTSEKIFLNQEYFFTNQKVICSRINEIKNSTERSFKCNLNLKSTKSYLSPLVDLRTCNIKLVNNVVEKSNGYEPRFGRNDQILKLYPIYKIQYTGSAIAAVSDSNIVGSPSNIKILEGYSSKAKGIIVKIERSTNSLWVKLLTDTTFRANETLIFQNISTLDEYPTNVFVTTNGVTEIPFNFNNGDNVVCVDRTSSNLNERYDNVISGKIVRWDSGLKELTISNNKQPINGDLYSSSTTPSFSRIPFSITEQTGIEQDPDVFRAGDILSYPNIATLDRAFAEIKSVAYGTGVLFTPEISSQNSSSLAKYVSKEIFVNTPSTSLDVRLTANLFEGDDVTVLYKIKSASSQTNFDNLEWMYFNGSGLPDQIIDPSPENVVSGYLEKQQSYKEYKYSVSNLPEFSSYAIKIVMRSSNPVFVPKIQDYRAVASY
jgi:hypothetical protein